MKILLLGASGYVGGVLRQRLGMNKNIDLYGTCHTNTGTACSDGLIRLDVMDTADVSDTLESVKPDIVIWSIAKFQNDIHGDETRLSDIGLRHLIGAISPAVRFIYISTMVCSEENHTEEAAVSKREPGDYMADYINGKILGESIVKNHANHVIVRPGQIFGKDAHGNPDIRMERILRQKQDGLKYPRAINMLFSIVSVRDLAECVAELCENKFKGIINVAAEKPVSYYEFYTHLASEIGIEDSFIVPYIASNASSSYYNVEKCKSKLAYKINDYF